MKNKAISIRPFIGAKDYELSRSFYRDLGFQESILTHNMSLFKIEGLGERMFFVRPFRDPLAFWRIFKIIIKKRQTNLRPGRFPPPL